MIGAAEKNAYPCIIDLSHKRCRDRDLGVVDYDDPDIGQGNFFEDFILMAILDDETIVLNAEVLRCADCDRK